MCARLDTIHIYIYIYVCVCSYVHICVFRCSCDCCGCMSYLTVHVFLSYLCMCLCHICVCMSYLIVRVLMLYLWISSSWYSRDGFISKIERYTRTKLDWKETELMLQKIISIPISKLHGFFFKVIILGSNDLSYPYLLPFYTLREIFFWKVSRLHHYGTLDGLYGFKIGPLKKKVTNRKIR